MDEATSRKYKDADRQSGLPIKIVLKPERKIKDLITESGALDKTTCTTTHHRTCSAPTEGSFSTKNIVYRIIALSTIVKRAMAERPTDHSVVDLMNTTVVQQIRHRSHMKTSHSLNNTEKSILYTVA